MAHSKSKSRNYQIEMPFSVFNGATLLIGGLLIIPSYQCSAGYSNVAYGKPNNSLNI